MKKPKFRNGERVITIRAYRTDVKGQPKGEREWNFASLIHGTIIETKWDEEGDVVYVIDYRQGREQLCSQWYEREIYRSLMEMAEDDMIPQDMIFGSMYNPEIMKRYEKWKREQDIIIKIHADFSESLSFAERQRRRFLDGDFRGGPLDDYCALCYGSCILKRGGCLGH